MSNSIYDPKYEYTQFFSEQIHKYREDRGLSQADLAKKLGVAKSTISLWETKRRVPSMEAIGEMCIKLAVPINYFSKQSFDDGNTYTFTLAVQETIKASPELRELIEVALLSEKEDIVMATDLLKRMNKK